jgi:hypothetical protein
VIRKPKQIDDETKAIERQLRSEYGSAHPHAQIKVYRYNPGAIRIRVVDKAFDGKSIKEREADVWPILEKLPESLQMEVSVCLLITPQEQATSLMNLEFEEPLPSGF